MSASTTDPASNAANDRTYLPEPELPPLKAEQLLLFMDEPTVTRLPDGAIRLSQPKLSKVIRKGTVKDVCNILGISKPTAIQLIRENEIHGWRKTTSPTSWFVVDLATVYAYRQRKMQEYQL